jgi:hypothetical protein
MKLKLADDGAAVVQDGKPVYVADDGREVAFDYTGTLATIARLNDEARSHRDRATSFENRLKLFDGIADPAAARDALQKVKDVQLGNLIHAGKLDEVKAEAEKAYKAQIESLYNPVVAERDALRGQLFQEIIGGSFARSKYIADKLAIPPDFVQARFGPHFAIDEGKIVAKDASGNRIFSRERPGEVADFDEALETLVGQYPYRASILKGSGASGSGANGGGQGTSQAGTMTRAHFESLTPVARVQLMREGKTQIVDS